MSCAEDIDTYKALNKPIKIKCLYHGEFTVLPKNHLKGQGSPECKPVVKNGWNRTDFIKQCEYNNKGRAIFYVITCYSWLYEHYKYYEKPFIKVGITSKKLKERFRPHTMLYRIKPVLVLEAEAGSIYDLEKKLKVNKPLRYEPLVPFGGQTECFTSYPNINSVT